MYVYVFLVPASISLKTVQLDDSNIVRHCCWICNLRLGMWGACKQRALIVKGEESGWGCSTPTVQSTTLMQLSQELLPLSTNYVLENNSSTNAVKTHQKMIRVDLKGLNGNTWFLIYWEPKSLLFKQIWSILLHFFDTNFLPKLTFKIHLNEHVLIYCFDRFLWLVKSPAALR